MFLRYLRRLVTGDERPVSATSPAPIPQRAAVADPRIPVYPPTDAGLDAYSVDDLLASQHLMLAKLRQASGFERSEFDRFALPVIRAFAGYIHLIPATKDLHHRGAGGLLRLGMETAFYALQASEGAIYAGQETTERKRLAETRWRYAAFVAGLCIDSWRALSQVVVTDEAGQSWPAYQQPLAQWLAAGGRARYFLRWRPVTVGGGSEFAPNSLILNQLLPAECANYVQEGGPTVLPTLLAVLTGAIVPGEQVTLNSVVLTVRRKVIERDAGIQAENYTRFSVGTHLEPNLIDAMRRLIRNGTWQVNVKRARLWRDEAGLYLVWKTAATEIIELLKADGVSGVPRDPDTLLDILVKARIIEGNPELPMEALRMVGTPLSDNPLPMAQIANPALLFSDLETLPAPVALALGARPAASAPVAAAAHASAPVLTPVSVTSSQNVHVPLAPAPPAAAASPSLPATGIVPPDVANVPLPPRAPTQTNAPATPPGAASQPAPPVPVQSAPPASGAPAPVPAATTSHGSAPADAPEATTEAEELVLSQVNPNARLVVLAIRDDLRKRHAPDEVWFAKELDTVVITSEHLNTYGMDITVVTKELGRAGWLYEAADAPGRKLHKIQRGGRQKTVVAFTPAIVKALSMRPQKAAAA